MIITLPLCARCGKEPAWWGTFRYDRGLITPSAVCAACDPLARYLDAALGVRLRRTAEGEEPFDG